MSRSPAEALAALGPEEWDKRLVELGEGGAQALLGNWHFHARPEQLVPRGDQLGYWLRGGRGSGKTKAASEDCKEWCREHPGSRVALVGPTFADGRDTIVEGDSGLLNVLAPSDLRGGNQEDAWNRSIGELFLANGCYLRLHSSEKPGRLRGPQWHRAYCDEPAEWSDADRDPDRMTGSGAKQQSTWSNLMFGLRLGDKPQVVISGTPKPVALIKYLLKHPGIVVSPPMSSYDNYVHLAPSFRADVLARYEGTRLGRQELYAELLEDVEGALWSQELIDAGRVKPGEAPIMSRIVVAVDPSWGTKGDECGIVVAGRGFDGRGYVLDDLSLRAAPAAWGAVVADAYRSWQADRIVAEVNFQAEQVKLVMQTVDPNLSFKELRASRGKQQRMEPIVALYEQGRISHVGIFGLLEAQLTQWVPGESDFSPDRADALTWALTDLLADITVAPNTTAYGNVVANTRIGG